MSRWPRRSFLKTSFGLPAIVTGQAGSGILDLDLQANPRWVTVGGRRAYAYAYNGAVPGPVIEATPGDHVRILFRNSLPEPTNLHYHGLHIPPAGSADNTLLMIPPGESFTYEFDIPATHRGGTFWYHAHVHQFAAHQVSRGLAGVFIVRGELDSVPEIAAAPESILVLQDFDFRSDGFPVEPGMMERIMGREGDLVVVNALVNPTIPIARDGWLRLRILNAATSRFYRLHLEEHPLFVIAVDGGALPSPDERDDVLLAPGERVEVMVRGARTEGSYGLFSLPYDRGGMGFGRMGGMRGSAPEPLVVATLAYSGYAARSWDLPNHLSSLDALPEPYLRRSFQLGQGSGMWFTINGRTFSPDRVDTRVHLNTVEEWDFVNPTAMDHPMHIHTNPFQVVDAGGTPVRAWKDVVLVPAGRRVRIRTAFRDFTGSTMYHCHILDHEDLGMMSRLEIQD